MPNQLKNAVKQKNTKRKKTNPAKKPVDVVEQSAEVKVSTYFVELLKRRPDLLKIRSNNDIYLQWLEDHPGNKEIPRNVAQTLANVKNKLRKELKIRKKASRTAAKLNNSDQPTGKIFNDLENLEHMIDHCLHVARAVERDDFEKIVYHLRSARNQVIKHFEQ